MSPAWRRRRRTGRDVAETHGLYRSQAGHREPCPPRVSSKTRAACALWRALVVCGIVMGASDVRATEIARSSLPLTPATLARPVPQVVAHEPAALPSGCGLNPLAMGSSTPLIPGEFLRWDVVVLGLRAGEVALHVAPTIDVEGVTVVPVSARVQTGAWWRLMGEVEATLVTLVDVETAMPVRMANEVVVREPWAMTASVTREDAAFAPATVGPRGPAGGAVHGRLEQLRQGARSRKEAHLTSRTDIVDVLGMVPWIRTRDLVRGRRFCLDLFHRRRLYRFEGRVGEVEQVDTPQGPRRARHIRAQLVRGGPRQPRPMDLWVSDDDDRVPLLARSPEGVGAIELRLTHHARAAAGAVPLQRESSTSSLLPDHHGVDVTMTPQPEATGAPEMPSAPATSNAAPVSQGVPTSP
jgi:hypothetical protein